ncbi:MAG: DUF2141 domain-containing protein [Rhodanobacteraceae bacterium]|nr:DUF2141 domain-containing protein [Rhodanobacteraceae bacterium]
MHRFISRAMLFLCTAAGAQAATLTVNVTQVKKAEGRLMVRLVDSAEAYQGKAEQLANRMFDVTSAGAMRIEFPDLKPGYYAVSVFHDENGNGKLDKNFVGIPSERYGFSTNPNVMGKPSYDEIKFEMPDSAHSITIELN